MRIGEVHAALREEFPTIELSKIRYYEDKGLVQPSRSRKGYRLYSPSDVACLREAFRLAQNEFVPLRVIRQRLIDQGLLADDGPNVQSRTAAHESAANIVSLPVRRAEVGDDDVRAHPAARAVVSEPRPVTPIVATPTVQIAGVRMNEAEFTAATRLTKSSVDDLIRFGLVVPCGVGESRVFTESDIDVAVRVRPLLARGVEIRLLQGLRRTVEREVDLVHDVTAPLRARGNGATADVRVVTDEIAELRAALMRRATSEVRRP
jgi:DNA-binding transcriptional MerR regulator